MQQRVVNEYSLGGSISAYTPGLLLSALGSLHFDERKGHGNKENLKSIKVAGHPNSLGH